MVPFSFLQPRLKSRVMKERALGKMVSGVIYQVSADDRQQDPIGGTAREDSRPTKGGLRRGKSTCHRKICKKPNEFAKIQVNPTKSNQIRPLFLWESRDEREGQRRSSFVN